MSEQQKQDRQKDKDGNYPENGKNFKAGREDTGTLPNNPAKNEELTSPEEDKKAGDPKQERSNSEKGA